MSLTYGKHENHSRNRTCDPVIQSLWITFCCGKPFFRLENNSGAAPINIHDWMMEWWSYHHCNDSSLHHSARPRVPTSCIRHVKLKTLCCFIHSSVMYLVLTSSCNLQCCQKGRQPNYPGSLGEDFLVGWLINIWFPKQSSLNVACDNNSTGVKLLFSQPESINCWCLIKICDKVSH